MTGCGRAPLSILVGYRVRVSWHESSRGIMPISCWRRLRMVRTVLGLAQGRQDFLMATDTRPGVPISNPAVRHGSSSTCVGCERGRLSAVVAQYLWLGLLVAPTVTRCVGQDRPEAACLPGGRGAVGEAGGFNAVRKVLTTIATPLTSMASCAGVSNSS